VELDENGNWVVEARGPEGQEVWIVIQGVGSFKLVEVQPNVYEVTILGSKFDSGKEYRYHFSDSEDGPDMASAYSGTLKAMDRSVDDGADWMLICCLGGIVVPILLAIVLILVLVTRKGRSKGSRSNEE
jgi:hypothetical protein